MKKKWFYLLFGILLCIPNVGFSQCASIYEKAMGYMEKGQYKTAIKYFRNAKVCDEALAVQCDSKIKECQRMISRTNKEPESIAFSTVITLDKDKLNFGSESTNAQLVKVKSALDWKCTSSEKWCIPSILDNKKISVSCEINKDVNKRTAVLEVSNNKETRKIYVIQEGIDSFIYSKTNLLEFSHKGDILEVNIECNTSYEVADKPEWVNVVSKDSEKMIIKVEATKNERMGVLSVQTKDGKMASIVIKQNRKKKLGIL